MSDWDQGTIFRLDSSNLELSVLISDLSEPLGLLFTSVSIDPPSVGKNSMNQCFQSLLKFNSDFYLTLVILTTVFSL